MIHDLILAAEFGAVWLLLIAIPLGLFLGPRLRSNSRRYTPEPPKSPTTEPAPVCDCGAPLPDGRHMCWRCRFEDDVHDYPIYDEDAA